MKTLRQLSDWYEMFNLFLELKRICRSNSNQLSTLLVMTSVYTVNCQTNNCFGRFLNGALCSFKRRNSNYVIHF